MTIDIVIIFLFGFTAGGILLWIIARLVSQKEILQRTDEIKLSHSARVSELEGRARYAEGQMDQLRRQTALRETRQDVRPLRRERRGADEQQRHKTP